MRTTTFALAMVLSCLSSVAVATPAARLPEPETWSLLAIGVVALVVAKICKRK